MILWMASLLWFLGCSEQTKTSYDNKADGIVGDPILEVSESFVIEENQSKDGEPVVQVLEGNQSIICLLYTSPSPRDGLLSRMPSSA